jgi:hypothetical protein
MSTSTRLFIGIFIILHGLVHPIMAFVPQPMEEQSDDNPPVIGGFWTESWLLGDGTTVKSAIYTLAVLTTAVFLVTGIGFMGSQTWAKPALLAGIGLSLLLLIVFWNVWLTLGIVIDLALLAVSPGTSWLTA